MNINFIDELTLSCMEQGVPLWKLSKKLGVHQNTLQNWRHKGLTDEQRKKIDIALKELKKEQEQ